MMTHNGNLVVDAVAHAYDMRRENAGSDLGRELVEAMYDRHANIYSPPDYVMAEDKWFRHTTAEEVEAVMFEESAADFAIYHAVELEGFFDGWIVPLDEGLEFRARNPDRVAVMGFVDPLSDDWEHEMERQVEEHGVDGIKLYPVSYRDGDHLQMSLQDPDTGRAVLEKAEELGVDNVGIHKLLPLMNSPVRHFRLDDVDAAAPAFPDIDIEIVHAGFSFLEDTVFSISRHPNVYANLESTSGLMQAQPRQFARIMGEMLKWAGPEKILLASGTITHPQAVIESFAEFQIPEDMREGYGYPKITPEMRERMMGLNALEIHGIDPDDVPRNDVDGARPEPWSHYA